ncbi:MAG: family 78 glycoside hydrolase catalytic domain [Luteolibacter sp.]
MLILSTLHASAASPAAPTTLRVNDVNAPVGTPASVYFGWQVNDPDSDEIQSARQILVSSSAEKLAANESDLWDSGKISARSQNHVTYDGPSLKSDQRYFWKVRTWDKDGNESPYSAPSSFTVGLNENTGWRGASWIRRENKDKDDYTYFRKKAAIPDKSIARATVYISATHKYSLYLNGRKIGKGQAYHQPEYQYYNAYDVTDALKAGADNQFAVLNHWFGGGQGRPASARGIILKAIIHHTDGTETIINTDGTWLQSRATAWVPDQPDRNKGEGVGFVETIDARELKDWTSLSFDDSTWAPAKVIGEHPVAPWTGQLAPELTRIEEQAITPVSITRKAPGKYVIDLGKVYAGMPRVTFSGGEAGTTITMRGAYTLDASGQIPPDAKEQSTLMEYRAVLDGKTFTYEPFEYLGLRYFQIDNSPMPVTKENFTFLSRHTRLDDSASSFESSNTTLNAVWELMKHSLFTCAQEEFVDTPTREKGGFLLDSIYQSMAGMPILHERALTRRALHEFLQSMDQHWSGAEDLGRMNAVYPTNDKRRDIPDFTQAYLTWVWNYYLETGDLDFLKQHYPKFKAIGDYMHGHQDASTGLITKLTGGTNAYLYGIIDWPATMRFGYDMETDARTVINGWGYAGYDILAKIAGQLGNAADQQEFRSRADTLKTAFNTKLIGPDNLYRDGLRADGTLSSHASQHANMFPLALGIVPEANRSSVIDEVKKQRMSVGMVTVRWLVLALGEARQGAHLIDLFTNPEWNGWAQTLSKGATATWESWDADTTGQSMSHAWGAIGLEGYTRYILGITPLKAQYEEVQIKPLDFGEKLASAKGKITTDRGAISVDWKRTADTYNLQVSIPVNVTAKVSVPKGSSAQTTVKVDGKSVTATEEGDYLILNGIGSGKHTIVR